MNSVSCGTAGVSPKFATSVRSSRLRDAPDEARLTRRPIQFVARCSGRSPHRCTTIRGTCARIASVHSAGGGHVTASRNVVRLSRTPDSQPAPSNVGRSRNQPAVQVCASV